MILNETNSELEEMNTPEAKREMLERSEDAFEDYEYDGEEKYFEFYDYSDVDYGE